MTRAREQLICYSDTPYYHCISRVVRKAFLCGFDRSTQQNYAHRRQWMIDRLAEIDQVFCIDICAYAIMSNHYHLVLYINKKQVDLLTNHQVIERWCQLYKGPEIIQRYIRGDKLTCAHLQLIDEIIDEWRSRLADISWYMRCLNEFIARKANIEDGCKGRFWEGRFKSQALLDEQALLTCMAYVELNPIRAKMATTTESSLFTSIKQRIEKLNTRRNGSIKERVTHLPLKSFLLPNERLKDQIPYHFKEYLYLVDWSGRVIREGKRGAIDSDLPPVLTRLNIDPDYWCDAMQPKGYHHFSRALGSKDKLLAYAAKLEVSWVKGIRLCSKMFLVIKQQ
jgi:REP element-mobilizing transposase RayT